MTWPMYQWYVPKPGDELRIIGSQPFRCSDFAADCVAIEQRMLDTRLYDREWNTPHACTYEGPWTRCSCQACDERDGKALVALFAFLLDRHDVLDQIRTNGLVPCTHEGARLYTPCETCCWMMRAYQRAGLDHGVHSIRSGSKRISFADVAFGGMY